MNFDYKPDENDLHPLQLAAALASGESHWRNLLQAAAYIRDAESQLAAETKRADEAEAECERWHGLCEKQQWAVGSLENKLAAADQARDEAERITAGCRDLIATLRTRLAEAELARDEAAREQGRHADT